MKNRAKQQLLREAGWPLSLFHLKFPTKPIRKPHRSWSRCGCATAWQMLLVIWGGHRQNCRPEELLPHLMLPLGAVRSTVRDSTASIHILRGIFNGYNSILLL